MSPAWGTQYQLSWVSTQSTYGYAARHPPPPAPTVLPSSLPVPAPQNVLRLACLATHEIAHGWAFAAGIKSMQI